jgi:hypothetical protein
VLSDSGLRHTLERYAIQSREFSEAVARLGKRDQSEPEFFERLEEAYKRQALCEETASELRKYLERFSKRLGA